MDSSFFVNAENVDLLWEVINDNVSVKNKLCGFLELYLLNQSI